MKLKTLLFIVLLIFSSGVFAQKNVQEVLKLQQDAWNRADLDGFMKYYWKSDSLQFVSKNGVKYGWQKVYNGYQKNYADKGEMGVLAFEILAVKPIGKTDCMVTGSWKVTNKSGVLGGYFTLWFKKINKQWLIVSDHTS